LKLWLILYVGIQIGGVWGPLPYEIDECKTRAATLATRVERIQQNPEIIAKMKAEGLDTDKLKQWRFECKHQDFRPFVNES